MHWGCRDVMAYLQHNPARNPNNIDNPYIETKNHAKPLNL